MSSYHFHVTADVIDSVRNRITMLSVVGIGTESFREYLKSRSIEFYDSFQQICRVIPFIYKFLLKNGFYLFLGITHLCFRHRGRVKFVIFHKLDTYLES